MRDMCHATTDKRELVLSRFFNGFMEILVKLTRSLFKEAEKNAEKAIKHFDPDSIHKMRVALKKIRAEFNLLLFFSQGKLSEKDIQKVKGIFKKAGTVRELQLVISNIESLP